MAFKRPYKTGKRDRGWIVTDGPWCRLWPCCGCHSNIVSWQMILSGDQWVPAPAQGR